MAFVPNALTEATSRVAREEMARFEKAEKLSPSAHKGAVLWPGNDYPPGDMNGEGWFSSVDVMLRRCADDGREPPRFVWPGTAFGVNLDAADVIDGALAEHHEGASDWLAMGAKAALQTLLDVWAKVYARDVKTWEQDTSRAIVLGEEERARFRTFCAEADANRARFLEEG